MAFQFLYNGYQLVSNIGDNVVTSVTIVYDGTNFNVKVNGVNTSPPFSLTGAVINCIDPVTSSTTVINNALSDIQSQFDETNVDWTPVFAGYSGTINPDNVVAKYSKSASLVMGYITILIPNGSPISFSYFTTSIGSLPYSTLRGQVQQRTTNGGATLTDAGGFVQGFYIYPGTTGSMQNCNYMLMFSYPIGS